MYKFKKIWPFIAAIFVPAACFWLLESFTYVPCENMSANAQILNLLFYYILLFILYGISGNTGIAIMLESVFVLVVGLSNYFVIQFRSSPIVPWDFFSIKTALSVSDNYSFEMSKRAMAVVSGFIIMFIIGITALKRGQKFTRQRIIKQLAFVISGIVMLSGLIKIIRLESTIAWAELNTTLFTPGVMCKYNGFAVTFMYDLQYMEVSAPSGYSREKAKKTLENYSEEPDVRQNLPNIIVIMDECFSDPAVLGDFETNMDYMPFLHKMQKGNKNTVTGNLHVSVLGGNTANTEFEFLTGNTMAFLPSGSVPYQQYINKEMPSMVSWLKELGYTANAVHPYYSKGWNREKAYSYLGFDNMYFRPSFDSDTEIIRKYVSDRSAFDKVLKLQREQDAPSFTFLVTMQNHGGFGIHYDGFESDIEVEGTNSIYPKNYLYLMKITDNALENLIEELSREDEDTVVVFFGDHQPYDIIVDPLLGLNGKSCGTLSKEEVPLRYEVPYLIWANFDIDDGVKVDTSPNYLGAQVFEMCGIPTSDYQNYLLDLCKEVPVISTQFAEGAGGGKPDGRIINDYEKMQYYRLFDSKK